RAALASQPVGAAGRAAGGAAPAGGAQGALTHVTDRRRGSGDRAPPLTETRTPAGGVLHEPLFLDGVEGGQGGPGGHRVTAVGAALGTGPGLLHDRGGRGDR